MRRCALILVIVCLPLPLATAQPPAHPPLIDRQAFFAEPQISATQVSPDGRSVAFLKPGPGTRTLWAAKAADPVSAARPLSVPAHPVLSYFWSRDSKYLVYLQEDAGESASLHAVDPSQGADAATGVPPGRTLIGLPGVRTVVYAAPRHRPDLLYVGINDRDPRWHDLYELHIGSGRRILLRRNSDSIDRWVADPDGRLQLAERVAPAGGTEILRVEAQSVQPLYSCTVQESCSIAAVNGGSAYLLTNHGDADLVELAALDPAAGATTRIETDPEGRADVAEVMVSDTDGRILFTTYEDTRPRRYFRDRQLEGDYRWLGTQLSGSEVALGSHSSDDNVWVVTAYSDTEPGATYLWNRSTRTLRLLYRIREELPRAALAERRPYFYTSSDGLLIRAYVTLPKGVPAANLPLIVWPHSGPWAQDTYGYDTYAQFFASRGYAVLQPNYRGSTGRGKRFLNAGNGEWGRRMQDDLAWGVQALVSGGTVDPKRVGIGGEAYGGYAALAGAAFTPHSYAAAVAYDAPSSLIAVLSALSPDQEAGRSRLYVRLADPTTPRGRATLIAQSPLRAAGQILAPLLVVQGRNDPRVSLHDSDQLVAVVRAHGHPVQYLVAPEEGHGFTRPLNTLAFVTAMERLFARHLGGQQQTDVPADVAARLAAITVDPAKGSRPAPVKGTVTARQRAPGD